ncbi:FimV family protein [Candidatus Magnetaquicoccus inordinatus]|uniref:type IV pilus assembly protein FimV n=1 Tax=Candidatus Magnetaquicoccus inordinatus TaxID=2496818 RepID=UPI00187D67F1|nr:FimV/HubP family polar landmark protein [Candidatus Magnetaquicoccus inordinatus]
MTAQRGKLQLVMGWLLLVLLMVTHHTEATAESRCAEAQANSAEKERLYGPIREGETLTTIARPLAKKYAVSSYQTQVAIWRRNPGQFVQANMNGLKSGCQLVLPAPEQFVQTGFEEAEQLLLAHAAEWRKPYSSRKNMAVLSSGSTSKERGERAFSEERPVLLTPEVHNSAHPAENLPVEQITSRLQSIVTLLEKNQQQMDALMQRVSAMENKQELFKQFDQRLSVLEGRLK